LNSSDPTSFRNLNLFLTIALVVLLGMSVGASPAAANSTQVLISHGLISQEVGDGGDLFFRETFDGNGRTCGSCHSVEDNQTIGPEFIATLPANDPLFVHEFNPDLTQLEVGQLLREFGLILENVDGMEDPTNKFVLRGTPASLSLATSIDRPAGSLLPPDPLGNSGDGAFAGTLNSFPTGATMQHFPKTLDRVEGDDFRLPTQAELDLMEAFMLELGRTEDLDLQTVSLSDSDAETGRQIFLNDGSNLSIAAGKCAICHSNAGANHVDGGNRNFDVGVEEVPHPARDLIPFPFDGGFGTDPNSEGTFGDGTFNTPPLVEAADTGPWFHNHVIDDLEEAVAFFSSTYFEDSPAADPDDGVGPINLLPAESDQVAAFLRVLNAGFNLAITDQRTAAAISLENSSSKCSGGGGGVELSVTGETGGLTDSASGGGGLQCPDSIDGGTNGTRATVDTLLALANTEAADALEVLNDRGLNPTAVSLIQSGIDKNQQAINTNGSNQRKSLMQSALADFQSAKADLGTGLDFVLGEANLMF
jgi:cytochrome c553